MTLQELFNLGWQKFVAEKAPASYADGECRYRGPNGARCMIGLAISDEEYDGSLEGLSALHLLMDGRIRQLAEISRDEANELQECHDLAVQRDSDFHVGVERRLRKFAGDHGLTIPAPAVPA